MDPPKRGPREMERSMPPNEGQRPAAQRMSWWRKWGHRWKRETHEQKSLDQHHYPPRHQERLDLTEKKDRREAESLDGSIVGIFDQRTGLFIA
jgi:hypothetical protein